EDSEFFTQITYGMEEFFYVLYKSHQGSQSKKIGNNFLPSVPDYQSYCQGTDDSYHRVKYSVIKYGFKVNIQVTPAKILKILIVFLLPVKQLGSVYSGNCFLQKGVNIGYFCPDDSESYSNFGSEYKGGDSQQDQYRKGYK
ncbi:unnamed protein product, partial [marine sediment metagenome]